MFKTIFLTVAALFLAVGPALADGMDGRFGVTLKAGALVPLKDAFIEATSETKSGLAYGGGLIYGFSRHLAGELDVTHAASLGVRQSGVKVGEVSMTDIALGLQYRLTPDSRLVPYIGAGVDVITGELDNNNGDKFDLSWTVGGHVNVGIDYFITRGIALSADIRGVYAAKGDVGSSRLDYDPRCVIGTIGLRLFLPEHLAL